MSKPILTNELILGLFEYALEYTKRNDCSDKGVCNLIYLAINSLFRLSYDEELFLRDEIMDKAEIIHLAIKYDADPSGVWWWKQNEAFELHRKPFMEDVIKHYKHLISIGHE